MKSIGRIVFSIREDELDFKKVSSNIGIKPTKTIKKGQKITSSRIAKFDIWRFEKEYSTLDNISEVLEELIDELNKNREYVVLLKNQYEYVGITCYLVTDFGQIGISMSSSSIEKLNALGIGIDFDIISYGKVED
ncbi:DUF4279 domain-containing protein [Chengkuizengella sediminis]|uniref:DUF4279 domain-containing protein n=1 Tax=Chengkuizengella sediminis TaxID=1885917 RepID=UPI00138A233F|nr:DUF4279 domain-containing protein [Chengkuizengella sediminis]NDI35101.1 DUF4279 domain-containing protein [Chengkuizengella sediminis]